MSIKPPEFLEMWHEGPTGVRTHFCGGQYCPGGLGQEGVSMAYTPLGTNFTDSWEAPFTTIYNSAAFQLGGTYGATVNDKFSFSLLFTIKSTANMNFRQAWSRFRKQLASDVDSKIFAKIPGVSKRHLTVRLEKTSNLKTITDPNEQQYGQVMIFFIGAYPRWVESDYTTTYTALSDTTGLTAPVQANATTSTTGGTLAAATYFYKVTALNGTGETTGSNEKSIAATGTTSKNTVSWAAVTNATGYKIYRSTSTNAEHLLATVGAVTTYADTGTATSGTTVPGGNTTTNPENGFVTVWNPTNTISWIKWMCQAGNANVEYTLPDFSWGSDIWNRASADAGRMIVMPELLNGEHIKVDTNPYALQGQVNSSLDTQVYLRMNGVQFLYPLPAYTAPTQIPVQIALAQSGNGIQVRCPLEWTHPWGME